MDFPKGLEKEILLKEIEASRKKMNLLARKQPLSSSEIVEISTYLDNLLNQYDECKKEKTAAL
ncbi:aspartyl-phosphate phosphatase Spo0E family protein [Guptibacillus algicola]|uniref:aspartyl-phosphate phosphatase Spo0E family protein n=1 Tax=Guptibacillus algicola TaxID=225844 RepID=UPI001CD699B3|nr:aspartyl-phosphate phosphatase Spo0E family protein [Alkalihalobacillus algicola]MCA0989535.1 aspartyl-phosphate phosphatase Spo0E family protein [Alkalihalobacillus algicola]